jgi:hypothetical protein
MRTGLEIHVFRKNMPRKEHRGRFEPAFAERDKKQAMIDLQGISSNWFKNQFCPTRRLSRLQVQRNGEGKLGVEQVAISVHVGWGEAGGALF